MTDKVNAKSSMVDIEVRINDIQSLLSYLQEEMNLKNVAYAFIARKGLMKEFRKFQQDFPKSFEDGNS